MTQETSKKTLIDLILDNSRIVVLLFLFLIIFGTWSFTSMRRGGFPEVLVNVALVQVSYPGASPNTVEDDVLKPLEEILADTDSVEEYETVANSSFGMAIVTFEQDADLDGAVAALSDEIKSIDFPDQVEDPEVTRISAGGAAQFFLGVTGPEDVQKLWQKAHDIADQLSSLDGVKRVFVVNDLSPQIHISLDEEKLKNNNLTKKDVQGAIAGSLLSAPAGSFTDTQAYKVTVSLQSTVSSVEDIKNITIKSNVALSDVAKVTQVLSNNDHYNRIGFRKNSGEFAVQRALVLGVKVADDADVLTVEEELKEELESINDGVQTPLLYNEATDTRNQIKEITSSLFGQKFDWGVLGFIGYLFGGLSLVLLLMLLFMNTRIAIMAAFAIPLSLLSATMVLALMGIGLNTLVLFSMVLAIGLVVDPTIVFLESMQRFKAQGLSGRVAARKTMKTVGRGVLLAVATNVLVFVPFGIVSGFFGQIIQFIPQTIIPAMVASLLIPVLFFVPLASKVLKTKENADATDLLTGVWKISRWFGRLVSGLLKKGWKWSALRIAVFVVAMVSPIIVGSALIGSDAIKVVQFSEPTDVDFIFVHSTIPAHWDFDRAVYDVVVPMQNQLAKYDEIKEFMYFEQNGNSFTLIVNLLPFDEREEKEMRKAKEVAADVDKWLQEQKFGVDIEAIDAGTGPPQDRFPVQVRLFDNNTDQLTAAADDVVSFLEKTDGIKSIKSSLQNNGDTTAVALRMSDDALIPALAVYGALRDELSDSEIGKVAIGNTDFDIILENTGVVDSLQKLQETVVVSSPFEDITVGDLTEVGTVQSAQTIRRVNGKRYVLVQATIDEGADSLELQQEVDEYLSEDKLRALGLSKDAADFKGTADSISKSFTELFIALLISIFLIYVLLVAFFRSYFEPFIILFAIPLGLIGVLGAVAATTGQLGFLELLGVVAMAGIVVNVTILLLDTANQLRDGGMSVDESIAHAVALRFRPIVLTQMTAFGSLIPLVAYSPFWKGLAAAIIFGIISSGLLSLFVTPILYHWSQKKWFNRKKKVLAA